MMQYDLTEEQYMLKDMIKRIAEKEIKPVLDEIELKGVPDSIYQTLVKQGLIAMPYPEAYGGGGGSVLDTCILAEELAKVDANCSMLATAHELGTTPIMIAGTEEQKQKYLSMVASGKTYCCFGLTEPDAGSDAGALKTKAVDMGDYYLVNGTKRFITHAAYSGLMTLFAKTDPTLGVKGISAFIVEMDWDGITIGKHEDKMGFRGLTASEVIFEDVKVPKENLLGKVGEGFKIAMKTLDKTRPIVGAMGVGLAQGALDFAIQYSKERIQFGKPIAVNQGLQFMMADMAMRIEAARQLAYKGACLADAGDPNAGLVGSMAKCFGTDVCMQVCVDALQIVGGSGYMKEYPMEKRMRDAKLLQIVEGTNQIQRVVIAGKILA
jgi:alkylation response protein AidB-like acyl-CoA dehydrogenase